MQLPSRPISGNKITNRSNPLQRKLNRLLEGQRVSDQVRVILKRKFLSDAELEDIRKLARQRLEADQSRNRNQTDGCTELSTANPLSPLEQVDVAECPPITWWAVMVTHYGYNPYGYPLDITHRPSITHSFYMDDLKINAKSSEQLQLVTMLKLVTAFFHSIKLTLGIDKCAVLHIQRGKPTMNQALKMSVEEGTISELEPSSTYKYLGFRQHFRIHTSEAQEQVECVFKRRVSLVKSSLCAKDCIRAINTWTIPPLVYTFGVLKWSKTKLEQLDRYMRTKMTAHRMHHPRVSMARLYLPRSTGGR